MWFQSFEERLQHWNRCRESVTDVREPQRWQLVNDWWWQAPMVARGLTWAQWPQWPGPWALLQQDGYTDLERALGIVYTLLMTHPPDQHRLRLVNTSSGNLVLVDQGKYILNWAPAQLLNIRSHPITVVQEIPGQQIQQKLIGNI